MNSVVEKIGQMNFDGNITPHTWYLSPKLQNEKGKPNLVAITLLADIIYWYRPTLIRGEHTGAVIGLKQKFDADKLQKHYEKWGRTFGLTKRQVEDAMAFLKAKGLVTVETRAVETSRGVLPHCAFIEPVFEAIFEITFPSPEKTGEAKRASARVLVPKKRGVSPEKTGDTPQKKGMTLPKKREHSYSTAKTSPETLTEKIPLPLTPSPASTVGEEEENLSCASDFRSKSEIKDETISVEQERRVDDMLTVMAKITRTPIYLDHLRPIILQCVAIDHKAAWTHTLTYVKKRMSVTADLPTCPNLLAVKVLQEALKSPVLCPGAKPAPSPPKPLVEATEPTPQPVDAPPVWAYKQARKELSGVKAAAFKAQYGRPSSEDDWTARAWELQAADNAARETSE